VNVEEAGLDRTAITRPQAGLIARGTASRFFDAAARQARSRGVASEEHLTVCDPLIEAWA